MMEINDHKPVWKLKKKKKKEDLNMHKRYCFYQLFIEAVFTAFDLFVAVLHQVLA